ncbi:hypothetical protein CK203_039134 [Vitis vinifera]|uniref:J domain-containing protein n=1 Tax=Vitis vinifera TaxID=29760 RepID=A0A438DQJ2_VITVI|nr:hypothetical protein CK203_100842 [Vitis vinifera]RVW95539.1 hypothetical protein CK203_039134 [Vitis vinifera]
MLLFNFPPTFKCNALQLKLYKPNLSILGHRILACFKLNAFEYLNLPFDSSPDDVKKQYRKLSLLVHPDKCKHPQAKEAFGGEGKERVGKKTFPLGMLN